MPKREKDTWANQLVEIVSAVKLFSRHSGISNDELAEELGIGERTVYRLKKSLDKMGIPLEEVKSEGARMRWRIPAQWTMTFPKTSDMGLSTPELLALYALRVNIGIFQGSTIRQDLDSAFEKIGRTLSPASKTMLERYSSIFISEPNAVKDYSKSDEIIEELSFAIIERTICNVRYHAFNNDRVNEYAIKPLHFFEREGGLYLFAFIADYEDVRSLAVERIEDVQATGLQFNYPSDFNPEKYLASAFTLFFDEPIDVKIRFTATQARYIRERTWAKNQDFQNAGDGSLILTMKTSGGEDIKRWVLSFGREAELLEPTSLRQEIIEELEAGLRLYK